MDLKVYVAVYDSHMAGGRVEDLSWIRKVESLTEAGMWPEIFC